MIHAKTILRQHSLGAADLAMGPGPFSVRFGSARAKVCNSHALSGIREIWVRNVYLGDDGFLKIPPDATVVDLGANNGNFTVLALAHGPQVRVVAVEPLTECMPKLMGNIACNGWQDRVSICKALIGGETSFQREMAQAGQIGGASFISEAQFVEQYNLRKIDLLKCDIEGSEFELLHPGSLLLAAAQQIAIELHDWGGNCDEFGEMLRNQGFEVIVRRLDPGCRIVNARRRS
jgi:FkbM family methyltransferase